MSDCGSDSVVTNSDGGDACSHQDHGEVSQAALCGDAESAAGLNPSKRPRVEKLNQPLG
jgi:hypothetical protein